MPITKDLERLFARAGRAEAARRQAEKDAAERRRHEVDRAELRRQRAVLAAPAAASRIWAWLAGAEAEKLREMLRANELTSVMLAGWMTREGRPLCAAAYGAWSVSLLPKPGTLWVHGIGAPIGGRARTVESPTALVEYTPPQILVALARSLRDESYVKTARESLRERIRPDALPPNIVRLG